MLTLEQLAVRTTGIGGSDAPAVCGVDSYRTPLEIYLSKVDDSYAPDLTGNEPVEHGTEFEEPIATMLSRRLGVELIKPLETIRHPDYPWMIANPDRLIAGRDKGVEIKNRSFFMRSSYGSQGSGDVLVSDILQCLLISIQI